MGFSEDLSLRITGDSKEAQAAVSDLGNRLADAFNQPEDALEQFGEQLEKWLTNPFLIATAAVGTFVVAGLEVVATLRDWAEHAAETGEGIRELSYKMNDTVENVSAVGAAVKASGSSFETLGNASFMLQQRLGENFAKVSGALRQVGIDVAAFQASAPSEQILMLSDAFRNLPAGINVAQAAFELFGRQGRELLPQLMQPLREMTDQARELGLVWSQQDAQAAEDFEDKTRLLDEAFERMRDRIGMAFLPVLDALVTSLLKNKDAVADVAVGAGLLKTAVEVAIPVVKTWFDVQVTGLKVLVDMGRYLPILGDVIGQAADQFGALGDALRKAAQRHEEEERAAEAARKALDDWFTKTQAETEALRKQLGVSGEYVDKLNAVKKAVADLEPATKAQIDAALKLGESEGKVDEALGLVAGTTREYKRELEDQKRAQDEATKADKERAKALEDFNEKTVIFAGSSRAENEILAGRINILKDLAPPWKSLDGAIKETGVGVDWIIKHGGPNIVKALDVSVPADQWKKFHEQLDGFAQSLTRLAQVTGGTFSGLVKGIAEIVTAWDMAAKAADNFKKATSAAGKALALVQGVTAVAAATQGGGAKGIAGGALTGAEMGAMFGPIGLGVGAAVGALIGAVRGHGNETKTDREALAKQLGFSDLGGLYADLEKLGEQGQKLADIGMHVVGKHDQAANEQWMKEVSQFYDDLKKKQQDLLNSLTDLDQKFAALGASVPDDLDSIIQGLIAAGHTKEAQQGIDDLTAAYTKYTDAVAATEAFKTIEQEMKDVGLTADDMNAKFRQARDEEAARTIAKDWKDLAPYVQDVNVLGDKFLAQIQQMVIDARSYETAIPESMKPVIQNLIDQGKLLDANGEKLTDMSALNFEEDPLQKSMDVLNQTMQDIRDVLKHLFDGVSNSGVQAAEDVGRALRDNIPSDIDVNVHPRFGQPSGGADLGDVPIADSPLRSVLRGGLVRVNPGDVVGMPHLTPGFGGIHFGDINVSGAAGTDSDSLRRMARDLRIYMTKEMQSAAARGEFAMPASGVRTNVSAR